MSKARTFEEWLGDYMQSDTVHVNNTALAEDAWNDGNSAQRERIAELESALSVITEHYVNLVKTGDCGNWNPETEPEVIKARSVLMPATEKEVA